MINHEPFSAEVFAPFEECFGLHLKAVLQNLVFDFVPKPKASCCGRPIVFPDPNWEYECDRCGKKYRLVVRVEEITVDEPLATQV